MLSPTDLLFADLKEKYDSQVATSAFTRLYEDPTFGYMFAVLHQRLNKHFLAINDRAKTTQHYWADPSRDLIALIEELNQDLHDLKRAGTEVVLAEGYQQAIEGCEPWLSPSGGSQVPDDFELIEVVKHEPVFSIPASGVTLEKRSSPIERRLVGEGSYAKVFSYVDPDYGIKFAIKQAKRGLSDRDQVRFEQEFAVMKRLSFPYIVEVYKFDDTKNEYRMEFCEETLRGYIEKRNTKLSFSSRKRIALQFLYGLNYIHTKGLLHRDVSLQNVLLKVYESDVAIVKLSDFGLVKDSSSEFTRTQSEMRGTIRDPALDDFKKYTVTNEMYSIGFVLSYIFTGRESLKSGVDGVGRIVQRCAAHESADRYATVLELIAEVERLEAIPTGAQA